MKKISTDKRIHLPSHMFLTSPRGLQKVILLKTYLNQEPDQLSQYLSST